MNMVRAGECKHPGEWKNTGYHELMESRQRYLIIDKKRLLNCLRHSGSYNLFKKWYEVTVNETLLSYGRHREAVWTESLAVGDQEWIERIKNSSGMSSLTITMHDSKLSQINQTSATYVLLSCNHFQMKDFVNQPLGEAPRDYARHMLEFFYSGVKSGLGTAIPHPFMTLGDLDIFDEVAASISDQEFLDAFGLATENGVAIEITTAFLPYKRKTPFSVDTSIRILSLAKLAKCKFTFGSDAHWPEAQKWLPDLVELTEPAGIIQEDILELPKAEHSD